ncbi:MAG: DUF2239 family protein [Candidatus Andeanibacterium colombiense]|uniref:DUF2239 family protein n=1 Tax=Candidatus Andeanibacterium colombiense TaxID=3121345 RepID=A0AAJ6BMN3_9SPHN|nr:MAG: DUF2239 family protein [Sphingomonadaceae bacterium]
MNVTVFLKGEPIARGPADDVAAVVRALEAPARADDLLVFDDETGKQVDLDLRPGAAPAARGRGRPSLGVEAKEVTLLPRHWEWLAGQRGGASATLRKLVEDALRKGRGAADHHDAAFRFLTVMAGDLPGFEDAMRAIYAGNRKGYEHLSEAWPSGIREHGARLAFPHSGLSASDA